MEAHEYNPELGRQEIRRIMIQGPPRQKVSKTPISTNKPVWWYAPVIPATQEAQTGKSRSESSPGQEHRTISGKQLNQKRARAWLKL
jgi:hypothetical protein